jgi:hypothetical protein
MSDTMIEFVRLFFEILPYVSLLVCFFMAGRSEGKGDKHDQTAWLLWAIMIWLMVIVFNGVVI